MARQFNVVISKSTMAESAEEARAIVIEAIQATADCGAPAGAYVEVYGDADRWAEHEAEI